MVFKYLEVYILLIAILLNSCYQKNKEPDYKLMALIKQQNEIECNNKTTIQLMPNQITLKIDEISNFYSNSFWIKNTGSIKFNIQDIYPSCDCIKINSKIIKSLNIRDSVKVDFIIDFTQEKTKTSKAIIVIGNCQYGNQTLYIKVQ